MASTTTEPWQSWVGRQGPVRHAYYPISPASIGYYCECLEDANPFYYDSEVAQSGRYGGQIAPPTFVMSATRTPTWWPGEKPTHQLLSLAVPLDITARINASVDEEFLSPLRPGDLVSFQSAITAITPKETRLGSGYFVAERIRYWNQDEEQVAVVVNTSFAYRPAGRGEPASSETPTGNRSAEVGTGRSATVPEGRPVGQGLSVGDELPPVSMDVTLRRLVVAAGGERDFNPLHHDHVEAARSGNRTAFANTLFQEGLCNRAVGEWLGPVGELRRLSLKMQSPIYVGRTLKVAGHVTALRQNGEVATVDLAIRLLTEDGLCSTAEATAWLRS